MRKIIFILALLTLARSHDGFAGEWNKARDLEVDRELAGMGMASTILPPGKQENSNMNPKQGQISGLGFSDAGATAKGSGPGTGSASPGVGNSVAGSVADVDLNTGAGGTEGSTESVPPDSGTDLTEETTPVGGDISGGEDYLISADASVGSTEVSVDLIPADSLDDTLVGETTDIGAEIDASGDLSGSEAEIGIEADVDGSVSGDDVGSDPADGISLATAAAI